MFHSQNVLVLFYRKDSSGLGEKWDRGVPIEVLPMAYVPVIQKIKQQLGGNPVLRIAKKKAVSSHRFIVKVSAKFIPIPFFLRSCESVLDFI